jgi:hypothetical protein
VENLILRIEEKGALSSQNEFLNELKFLAKANADVVE